MALVVPDLSDLIMLSLILKQTTTYVQRDQTLKLFQNNITPGDGDVTGTYTEATFTGYASVPITGTSWTISTTSHVTTAAYAQQTFSSTANQTAQSIYGYYVISQTDGNLYWAERFTNGPYVIANNGDQIKVTLQITLE